MYSLYWLITSTYTKFSRGHEEILQYTHDYYHGRKLHLKSVAYDHRVKSINEIKHNIIIETQSIKINLNKLKYVFGSNEELECGTFINSIYKYLSKIKPSLDEKEIFTIVKDNTYIELFSKTHDSYQKILALVDKHMDVSEIY